MTTVHSLCETCSTPFEHEPVKFNGRVIFATRHCDPCVLKFKQDELERPQREARKARRNRFDHMIPPIYHESDIHRLPKALVEASEMWTFNPVGLGFIGGSGKGKTRAAVLLLKRMEEEGYNTFFLSGTDLALNSANQFADNPTIKTIALSILACCRKADVLMLDDLGKNKMTDRSESELYDLLEYRTSRRLPTIWTSNSAGKDLRSMFSQDRGEAIIRRLGSEFSTIVKL